MTQESRSAPTVSVVVPCLNEEHYIEPLLDAVRLQDFAPHEVIVADCGSRDGTPAILERYRGRYPEFPLRLISSPSATIPIALNTAIAAAQGEIIARLDAHSRPLTGYIRQLVKVLGDTGAGVVGGAWTISPGADTATARAIGYAASHPLGAGDAAYRISPQGAARKEVDTVPYGCYCRSTWQRVGGYNEELQTNEDYEFNYRVRLSGMKVILYPVIRCTYFARATLPQLAAQYFRYGWWKAKMLKRHPRSIRVRQVIPVGFVAGLIVLAALSFFTRGAQWMLGSAAAFYALVLCLVSFQSGIISRDWRAGLALPAAFATIHFSWGLGVLTNLLSLGMWLPQKMSRKAC